MPAGGWEMSRIDQTEITVETASGRNPTVPVNRAVIQKGLSKQLVYYWFEQRGRQLSSDYAAKAYTVIDSMTTGRSDGALVRLITPIVPGEEESAADARLQAFMRVSLDVLPTYVPN